LQTVFATQTTHQMNKPTFINVHRKALRTIPHSMLIKLSLIFLLTVKIHLTDAQACTNLWPPTLSNFHKAIQESQGTLKICPFTIHRGDCDVEGKPYVVPFRRLQLFCVKGQDTSCVIDCPGRHFEVGPGTRLSLEKFDLRGATDSSILVKPSGVLIAKYNRFDRNVGHNGGAVVANTKSKLLLQFNDFDNNRARLNGGALYIESSYASVRVSSFVGNSAIDGGCIYVPEVLASSRLYVQQNTFASNSADFKGALIVMESSLIYFNNYNLACDNVSPDDCEGALTKDGACEPFYEGGVCESPTSYPTPRKFLNSPCMF
jgi:hypothetical protein